MSQRALLLNDVARRIPDDLGRPVRVGVDGEDDSSRRSNRTATGASGEARMTS